MPSSVKKLPGAAFLSFPGMYEALESELRERFGCSLDSAVRFGDLLYVPHTENLLINNLTDIDASRTERELPSGVFPIRVPCWCRSAMLSPLSVEFDSIGDASRLLCGIQRNWAPYSCRFFRRAALIGEKLPYINLKERSFPARIPTVPIGLYTLTGEHAMIASGDTTSFLPAGTIRFTENHEDPPSRAYLKLYEALTHAGIFFGREPPSKGERCFDAGASPGGWTWVLAGLGCSVLSVDRAELAPPLMKNPHVEFLRHDAFTLKPEDIGACDWVFSDVICYPERLYEWIGTWLASGLCRNMICTVKMQGRIDWRLMEKFASLPGSRLIHLNYNKHELTWLYCSKNDPEKIDKPGVPPEKMQ